jgi:formate dehydrogenase subunit gamma
LAGHEEYLPEVGKYNAGQKFVFWAQAVLITVMLVTGIGLWDQELGFFQRITGYQLTIDDRRLAAVIHATAAVLSIMVWIIHVYAALWVKGTIPAMTQGTVTGGWGWRHHRKWLRKKVAEPAAIEKSGQSQLAAGE